MRHIVCHLQWRLAQDTPAGVPGQCCRVIQAKIGRDSMPFVSGSGKTVSSILWGEAGWTERIFDDAAYDVKRAHVDAFFSLIAADIISIHGAVCRRCPLVNKLRRERRSHLCERRGVDLSRHLLANTSATTSTQIRSTENRCLNKK